MNDKRYLDEAIASANLARDKMRVVKKKKELYDLRWQKRQDLETKICQNLELKTGLFYENYRAMFENLRLFSKEHNDSNEKRLWAEYDFALDTYSKCTENLEKITSEGVSDRQS